MYYMYGGLFALHRCAGGTFLGTYHGRLSPEYHPSPGIIREYPITVI